MTEQQLAVLRYVRDHKVSTADTVAREVLGAPVTTFGRTLKRRKAEQELAPLVEAGYLARSGEGRQTEFAVTQRGRRLLRDAALESDGPGRM